MSKVDMELREGGRVEGFFSFASNESFGGLPLDRNHDGVIAPEEVAAARDELRAFLLDGVEVSADRARCPATFEGASLVEFDGLVLEARYDCPPDVGEIEVTLFYLNDLGESHREVARILAPGASAEAILTRDRRELTLGLPPRHGPARVASPSKRWLVAIFGALVLATILVLVRRPRRTGRLT
jgi:hypothetical protein